MQQPKFLLISVALVLCMIIPMSFAQNFPFPQSALRYMATRQMRYHHFMWHQVRENWFSFSESTRRQFRDINWEPPNPSRDSRGNRIRNNYAGEDFLYMHRQMLGTARRTAAQNGESTGPISGWATIPAPGDRTYPVPPSYGRRGSNDYKTNNYYYNSIQGEEQRMRNPNNLRRMSLNELGLQLEGGLHNAMHMRWSASSSNGYRGNGVTNGIPNVNRQWDDVNYNWLIDTYASQANPFFYKLHGWIDDRIEDWRRANGLSSTTWRGTWVGGPMSNLGNVLWKEGEDMDGMDMNDDPDAVGEVLTQAFEIFQKSGVPEFFIGDHGTTLPPKKRKTVKTCKMVPKKTKKLYNM